MVKYSKILCISDMHLPYCHPDTLKFLKALKEKYIPDKVVCLGDEVDYHSLSFHASDPDLDSAGKELAKALAYIDSIYELFPECDVLESNHGSMAYRKAKFHGMPRHLLKSYKDVLFAPQGWSWHRDLVLTMSNGQKVLFVHGFRKNSLAESQRCKMNFVQGHHHSQAEIRYHCGPDYQQQFGMTVGCMIDDISLAFEYNKLYSARPILSHAIIENGVPKILPMFLNKRLRWNGQVP